MRRREFIALLGGAATSPLTARALRMDVPPGVLVLATEVIE